MHAREAGRHRAATRASGLMISSSACSDLRELLQLGGQVFRGGRPRLLASMRRRSPSSNRRHASWNLRVSKAAYAEGIGGRLVPAHPSTRLYDRRRREPESARISSQIATRFACSRATACARSLFPRTRSCCRWATVIPYCLRRRLELLHERGVDGRRRPAARPTRAASPSARRPRRPDPRPPPTLRRGAADPARAGDRRRPCGHRLPRWPAGQPPPSDEAWRGLAGRPPCCEHAATWRPATRYRCGII